MHFKMNPEALFHREKEDSQLSELRTENGVLKQRLGELAREVEEARRSREVAEAGTSSSSAAAGASGGRGTGEVGELGRDSGR